MPFPTMLRRYARAGWRHRWKSLALAWLICAAGWTGVYLMPNQFEANARLYADADIILGQLLSGIAVDSSPARQVELLQRTLLSRPNLERVIARTDLDQQVDSIAAREALLRRLEREIRIWGQTRNLFTISYTAPDPKLARDVVQTVLDLFIEQANNSDLQQMESARAFLNQQIAGYEAQLREAEQRRADFRARYLELLPEGPSGITGLEQARTKLQQLRGQLVDAQQRHALTRQQLEATPAVLSAAEAAGPGGESRLAAAERTLRELRLRYTDQHPDVIAARNLVAELRSSGDGARAPAAGARPAARTNPLHEQLRLRLVDADAAIASLERQIGEEEATVERLETIARNAPHLQAQFINLDRDYTVLRKNYEELLERRESLQIAGAARTGADRVRLEVVDPPTLPLVPAGPKRMLLASGVLLAGLGAGAGLALLLVKLDAGFYTLHDLRRLGLPVLGGLSVAHPMPRNGAALAAFAGGLGLLLATYGAVLTQGPQLAAKLPQLVARMIA